MPIDDRHVTQLRIISLISSFILLSNISSYKIIFNLYYILVVNYIDEDKRDYVNIINISILN